MSNSITISGNLSADPELRYTPNGKAVVKFQIADTPRRLNTQSNQWEDGTTLWVRVEAWGNLAENAAASLKKGSNVVVVGKLTQDNYEKDGEKKVAIKLQADDIAPSLKNAVAHIERKSASASASNSSAPVAKAPVASADEDTPF